MKTLIKNFNSKNINAFNLKNSTLNKFQASNFHNLHNLNHKYSNKNKFMTNNNNFMKQNYYNFSTNNTLKAIKDKILNILDPDQVTSVKSVRILMINIYLLLLTI
jgi:hypothetical protein